MKTADISVNLEKVDLEISSILHPPAPFLSGISRQVPRDGGKKRRGRLIVILGRLLCAHPRDLEGTAAAVEVIHLATLIHDDVIDSAPRRRSRPTLQRKHGAAPAILYGDILFSRGIARVNRIGNRDLTDLLLKTVGALCAGEILENQLAWKFPWTEKDYLEVATLKTASLFEYSSRAPAILAGLPKRRLNILSRFGRNLGLSYQAFDDCLDFMPGGDKAGKDRLADLKNGVPSLPVIFAGRDGVLREELKKKLRAGLTAREAGSLARSIRERGYLREAREQANNYLKAARRAGRIIGQWGDRRFAMLLESYLEEHAAAFGVTEEC